MKDIYRYEKITKETEIYGVIADPVAHSLSPRVHNVAFEALQLNKVYVPFRVPREDLGSFLDGGLPLLSAAVDGAIVAVGAEALGGMDVLCQMTVEYSRNRVQFGQPIGKFQVLQHRMVDMFMECEQTRSLVYLATLRLPEGGAEAERAVAALKVQVGRVGGSSASRPCSCMAP